MDSHSHGIRRIAPSRTAITRVLVVLLIISSVFASPALAQQNNGEESELKSTITAVVNWLTGIIVAAGIIFGAVGILKLVAAGSSNEKQQDAWKQIRAVFYGLVGIAIFRGAYWGLVEAAGLTL